MQCGSIDEFDVGQILGRGGFGMVHRARHRSTGRDVALKIIDKQHMRGANMTGRVVNEVTLHSALRHPHVVELLGYFEDGHCVYLVMELCCRGDLYRYVRKKGRLQEDEAAALLVQVLSALAYLHRQHIVHRDLKLSNLLLTREHVVKLSDFGLAVRLQTPDEEHYTICGTPNYIAPEMTTQCPHGLPADLWSVGCLFYTLVAGKAPFQGGETSETLERASKGKYCMPAGLSEQAIDFLQSLLQTDPDHRMSITSVLAHPFVRRHSACLPAPCSPPPLPPTPQHDPSSPFQGPACPLPPILKPPPYARPSSSSSGKSGLGPCSLSTYSTTTASTAVQTMDALEPVSAHTAQASRPSPPLPPTVRPASDTDLPPALQPEAKCDPQLLPATTAVSPPPAASTHQSPSTGCGDGVSRRSPPSARKRRLPGPLPSFPSPSQQAPPPPSSAPLLTPLCTTGLPPLSFALPRRSSLRLHRDGRLTLRLPSASLCITHHGLRVHVTPKPRPDEAEESPTIPAASGPTARRAHVYTYSLMELPLCWRPAYTYAARLLDRIRSRVPKVTLFVLRRAQEGTPSTARPDIRQLQPIGDTNDAPVAKCMLMTNGPLPDFLVRWVDGTCLSYQLSNGSLNLRMATHQAGAVGSLVFEWSLKGRSHGWSSVCGNPKANTYLRLAQQAMLRCLELEPTSAPPSTNPASLKVLQRANGDSSCVFYEYVDALEGGTASINRLYMPPPRPVVDLPIVTTQPQDRNATERIKDGRPSLEEPDRPEERRWGQEQETKSPPSEPPPSAVPHCELEASKARPSPPPSPRPHAVQPAKSPAPLPQPLPVAAPALPPVPSHAVEVEGVGHGWRDEPSGQLVVVFRDGAVLRLSQDADRVCYTPSAQVEGGGSADSQTYPLPGIGIPTATRGKIPKPVRDRMKHLAAFIQKVHRRQEGAH